MDHPSQSVTTINRFQEIDKKMIMSYAAHGEPALVLESLKVLGGSERANMLADDGALLELAIRSGDVDVLYNLWGHCVEHFLEPRKNERDEPPSDDDEDDVYDVNRRVSFRRMERNFLDVTDVWRKLIASDGDMQRLVDECKDYFHAASH